METISWGDFTKVELRVGRVHEARPFPEARKPAYVLASCIPDRDVPLGAKLL